MKNYSHEDKYLRFEKNDLKPILLIISFEIIASSFIAFSFFSLS